MIALCVWISFLFVRALTVWPYFRMDFARWFWIFIFRFNVDIELNVGKNLMKFAIPYLEWEIVRSLLILVKNFVSCTLIYKVIIFSISIQFFAILSKILVTTSSLENIFHYSSKTCPDLLIGRFFYEDQPIL